MRDEQCDADFLVLVGGGRRGAPQVQGAALEVGLAPATRKKKKKQESEEPVKQHPKGGGLLRAPSTPPASPPSPHFLLRSTSLVAERRDSPTAKVASLGGGMAVEKAVAGMGAFEGGACDGFGRKLYANGDYYEGGWRRGLQEGQGRYVWRNGNQYVGQWRGGVIAGRGVLVWSDGSRYEGRWEGGVPRGGGVFTWPDGGRYIGGWAKDPTNQRQLHGTFYPSGRSAGGRHCQMLPRRSNPYPNPSPLLYLASPSSTADGNGDARQVPPLFRKRYSVDGTSGKGGGITEKSLPRICIWESDGEGGDITCEIIDTLEASMLCRSGSSIADATVAGADRGVQRRRERSPCSLVGNEAKKPGQTVAKGHKNYDLMLNLQLGIRYSTSKHPSSTQVRGLRQGDFDPREKFWTRFPPEGSKITPPHQSVEFRWKDYCPMVFRHFRKLFAVDPADYMLAICGDDALRELSSPGKSGSLFYLTQDDRFIIKTVKKSEVKVLIRMLSNYYQHVCRYKDSLVTKFYGVHCVKPLGGQKVRFIVMGNFFCSEYRIHRRFDLKGSSHGRMIDRAEEQIDETTTLKDLDLNFAFCLSHNWFKALLEQVDRDCEFLETEGIMDYSLLVGLHFRNDLPTSATGERDFVSDGRSLSELYPREPAVGDTRHVLSDRRPLMRLGVNLPAKAERICRSRPKSYLLSLGASTTPECNDTYDVVLNFGIIDILQDYDISKKLEHAYKSLHADPASISAVDPKLYSKRFRDFIRRVFVEVR